jgi:hypothetical protein
LSQSASGKPEEGKGEVLEGEERKIVLLVGVVGRREEGVEVAEQQRFE